MWYIYLHVCWIRTVYPQALRGCSLWRENGGLHLRNVKETISRHDIINIQCNLARDRAKWHYTCKTNSAQALVLYCTIRSYLNWTNFFLFCFCSARWLRNLSLRLRRFEFPRSLSSSELASFALEFLADVKVAHGQIRSLQVMSWDIW